jgi:hypothetical protein
MSQSFDSVAYTVAVNDDSTGAAGSIQFAVQAGPNNPLTDAFILSVVTALRGLDWPAGSAPGISATKNVYHSDSWICQAFTNPAEFD